ncbi:hypothetical protein [Clostridium sp.]|uniref:hypothetical protein n=1 Tax=Clostridium sp. TaxID=1506 RepID=UPI002FC5B1C9
MRRNIIIILIILLISGIYFWPRDLIKVESDNLKNVPSLQLKIISRSNILDPGQAVEINNVDIIIKLLKQLETYKGIPSLASYKKLDNLPSYYINVSSNNEEILSISLKGDSYIYFLGKRGTNTYKVINSKLDFEFIKSLTNQYKVNVIITPIKSIHSLNILMVG